ncbi:MAG: GNAT family N-acetyltransferase [Pseudomonadota bacterium]
MTRGVDPSPERLTIRQATDADCTLCVSQSTALGGPVIAAAGRLWNLANQDCLVAGQDNDITGWAFLDASSGLLIAMKAQKLQQGIGRALWRHALSIAPGKLTVETTDDNVTAQAFYRAMGCQLIATYPFTEVLKLKSLPTGEIILGQNRQPIRHVLRFETTA